MYLNLFDPIWWIDNINYERYDCVGNENGVLRGYQATISENDREITTITS